ncbi:MAG TPA: hypothetical protein VJT67_01690 [Longimicrobiaceae bacterium]|nr:hypothetical protein [Longimicrobiaceae bacterium]
MPRLKLLAVAFVAALASAACVGQGKNAPVPQAPASVFVQNRAFIDVDVFALYGGTRARLGTVTANGTGTFRIPPGIVGEGRDLRFMVDPIGSTRTGTSFDIYVRPGQRITLTVPPSIAQ